MEGLYQQYHRYGLDVVGVETPEFTFEQEAGNVRQAIHTDGITYPVVQDNRYGTWDAYGNQYWPAEYYIDATGEVRRYEPGEGGGTWSVGSQAVTPSGASATISGDVQARDVYLVMTSAGNKPRRGADGPRHQPNKKSACDLTFGRWPT